MMTKLPKYTVEQYTVVHPHNGDEWNKWKVTFENRKSVEFYDKPTEEDIIQKYAQLLADEAWDQQKRHIEEAFINDFVTHLKIVTIAMLAFSFTSCAHIEQGARIVQAPVLAVTTTALYPLWLFGAAHSAINGDSDTAKIFLALPWLMTEAYVTGKL